MNSKYKAIYLPSSTMTPIGALRCHYGRHRRPQIGRSLMVPVMVALDAWRFAFVCSALFPTRKWWTGQPKWVVRKVVPYCSYTAPLLSRPPNCQHSPLATQSASRRCLFRRKELAHRSQHGAIYHFWAAWTHTKHNLIVWLCRRLAGEANSFGDSRLEACRVDLCAHGIARGCSRHCSTEPLDNVEEMVRTAGWC